MPGFEVMGAQEKRALNDIFEKSNGVLFAHGFDALRKGIFRVRNFEKEFSRKMGVNYSQAVSSGSAALKVGLKALGVGPGDEVITQAFTFVATVEAILDVGATPIVVDVDESLNMCPVSLNRAITKRTKVVIPVHMLGSSAKMDAISAICRKKRIKILEDACQACGGSFKGRKLGAIGDVGCFSFDFGKAITCGEGGVVATNNKKTYINARAYHDHGHAYSTTVPRGQEKALLAGFNYRMTELQAAVISEQLKKLDLIIKAQFRHKKLMKAYLSGREKELGIKFRELPDEKGDAADALVFFVGSKNRAVLIREKLAKNGIGTKNLPDAFYWHFAGEWGHLFAGHPVYRTAYKKAWAKTRSLLEQSIALPVLVRESPEGIRNRMENVVSVLRETMHR